MVEFGDLSKIDPAVIAREVQALREDFSRRAVKDAFTYRDFSRDLDLLLDDLTRDEPANPLGLGVDGVAEPFLEDCYFEKGALEPLPSCWRSPRCAQHPRSRRTGQRAMWPGAMRSSTTGAPRNGTRAGGSSRAPYL